MPLQKTEAARQKFRPTIEAKPRELATEILSLTKMNWNDTHFDDTAPIALMAADCDIATLP